MTRYKKLFEAKKKGRKEHLTWGDNDLTKVSDIKEAEAAKDFRQPEPELGQSFETAPHMEHHVESGHEMSPSEEHHWKKHALSLEEKMGHGRYTSVYFGYKGSSSGYVNDQLRNADNHDEQGNIHVRSDHFESLDTKTHVDDVDHLTSAHTIHPMHVYRGFRSGIGFHKDAKPGDIYQDHGFTGTSLKSHIAINFSGMSATKEHGDVRHVAKIYVPPGTKGHYIDVDGRSSYSSEKEFLLHRGTHFKVLGHSIHKDTVSNSEKIHVLHLEVIGQHPKNVVGKRWSKGDWR